MDVLREFRPAVVWLFAAQGIEDYVEWAENVRNVSRGSQVWVQIGSVEGAVRVAERVRPDVLCIQVSFVSRLEEVEPRKRRRGLLSDLSSTEAA